MIGSSPSNNYTRQTSVGGRCVLLAGIFSVQSCATQVLAALLKNPSQIGWGVYGLYFPFAWISWVLKNPGHGAIPTVLGVAILGTAVVFIVYMLWLKGEQKGAGNPNLHGTASFAKEEHIRQMGLMLEGGSPGVYIGAWQDKRGRTRYLQHGGAEHIILYAPTRSGKGISTVLPTLLSWQQSVLVTDIKGELYALTSGWRQKYANNKVLKLDLVSTSEESTHFNPLCEIRLGTDHEQKDAYNQALMIVDAHGHGLTTHWDKTGYLFIAGVILHCLYRWKNENKPTPSLAEVASFLSQPGKEFDKSLDEMLSYMHRDGNTHRASKCSR